MKFACALFIACLFALSQPWVTVASESPCPCKCGCNLDCKCVGQPFNCSRSCDCKVAFTDTPISGESESVPGDVTKGTAYYGPDGKQCGWFTHATMTYRPLPDHGTFGPSCPIPATATAVKAVGGHAPPGIPPGQWPYLQATPSALGGCANGQCGQTSQPTHTRFSIFGR